MLSVLVCFLVVFTSIPVYANDGDTNVIKVNDATGLPDEIPAGTTYELTADITLASGQQINTLAGTLDGKGHTIILADKPLANEVSGTVQNLGVTGALTLSNGAGTIINKLNGGSLLNSWSTVSATLPDWTAAGGLIGDMENGKVKNCYYAGTTILGTLSEFGAITCKGSNGTNTASDSYYTTSSANVTGLKTLGKSRKEIGTSGMHV